MKKLIFLLVLVGCVDIAGVDDHINDIVDDSIVTAVVCVTPLVLGTQGECRAENANGTVISLQGFAPVIWVSSAPSVVQINQDGTVTGISSGTASITATGTRGSTSPPFVVTVP